MEGETPSSNCPAFLIDKQTNILQNNNIGKSRYRVACLSFLTMGGLRSMNKYELAMLIVAILTLIVTALNLFK